MFLGQDTANFWCWIEVGLYLAGRKQIFIMIFT